MKASIMSLCFAGLLAATIANAGVVDDLLARYKSAGVENFSSERGKVMWTKIFKDSDSGEDRSCQTCHTRNLGKQGKQVNTGEVIEPLAPSVNSKRLTDARFIEKWFLRNCKWTLGRECTQQEKGDFLMFLRTQ